LERKKEKEKLAIEKRRKKEILTLENLIEEKEKKIEELDRLLCKPELYEEPDKIVQLTKDRDNLQTDLDSLYEKWIIMTEN
jgi:ATP-binding cassette subfamily F protein 3